MKPTLQRIAVLVISGALASCAADRIHRDGLDALDHGAHEEGIGKLEQAVKADPGNLTYRLDLRARKEAAVQQLVSAGDSARSSGQPDAAEAQYRRVLVIEPGNDRALHGLAGVQADRHHVQQVADADKLLASGRLDAAEAEARAVLAEDPGFAAAIALTARIDVARGPTTAAPRLKASESRPVTLQFRDAPTKMVFEVLARQTGVNFIFDKDVKSDGKTTIFVTQVPVESAIDLILAQNQLARQVLSENMVLIYPNTSAKQKDYQDEIVRTFYLANAAPKEAETLLKTVLGTKTLFVDERTSVIVMRDTPEHVRMAEKLVASLDVPEAEVMMEVEVLEITRSNLQKLGINYPTNVALAATSATGGTGLLLSDLHKQNSGSITVSSLGVSLDLLKTVGLTNVLASPRIRAKNKEKAKILIGNRVPVITSGTTSTTGGAYSTSNVQYLDVGLTLDVVPTIHADGNVAIKMGLEVSSIVKEVDVTTASGSTVAYQIGTRNANTTLELRDGETQVLAGLIQDNETRNSSHIPGLGDIPLLGRLFGSRNDQTDKSEIILSITPRIIRAQTRPSSETTEFYYGTESGTRAVPFSGTAMTVAPGAAAGPLTPGAVSYSAGGGTSSGSPYPAQRQAPPARLDAVAVPVASTPPAAIGQDAGATADSADVAEVKPVSAASSNGKASVSIDGPDSAKVGDEINVAVRVAAGEPLGKVRAQVRFDATALQLVSAEAGELAAASGSPKVDSRAGGVQVDFDTGGEGATSGSIVNLRFKAVTARPNLAIATQVVLVGVDGAAVAATPATPLKIVVTQ